ncbi:MAG: hypothetical protein K9L23_21775 [Desulfotignum sp.]|nr:hypothetical protein [Desulfotignum sp.]
MSEEAGGFIVVGAVAGGAILSAGAATVGAGYLLCKAGARAIHTCKDKWDQHLESLARERQKRLEKMYIADQDQEKKLQARLMEWAEDETLQVQTEALYLKKKTQLEEILLLNEKQSKIAAGWKRVELLNQELARSVPQAQMDAMGQTSAPWTQSDLEKARNLLKNELEKKEKKISDDMSLKLFPAEAVSEKTVFNKHKSDSLKENLRQLSKLKVKTATFLFLSKRQRTDINRSLNALETIIRESADSNQENIENRIDALNTQLSGLADENNQRKNIWEEAQTLYFSLYERYVTAKQDPSFDHLVKDPLEKLDRFLKQARNQLCDMPSDIEKLKHSLEQYQKDFQTQVNEALLNHQKNLNRESQEKIIRAMEKCGYQIVAQEQQRAGVFISGTKKLAGEKDQAGIQFLLNPEGYLSMDLSRGGFKNQTACSQEFRMIQTALRQQGLFIDYEKQQKTWASQMVAFLKNKLEEMGYSEKNITVEAFDGGKKISAVQSSGSRTHVILDEKTGSWIQDSDETEKAETGSAVSPPKIKPKKVDRSDNEQYEQN